MKRRQENKERITSTPRTSHYFTHDVIITISISMSPIYTLRVTPRCFQAWRRLRRPPTAASWPSSPQSASSRCGDSHQKPNDNGEQTLTPIYIYIIYYFHYITASYLQEFLRQVLRRYELLVAHPNGLDKRLIRTHIVPSTAKVSQHRHIT